MVLLLPPEGVRDYAGPAFFYGFLEPNFIIYQNKVRAAISMFPKLVLPFSP
jgi:hypothetical protein